MPERPPRSVVKPGPLDGLPDVRDGLTRLERVILYETHKLQKERRGRPAPTATLYGRVVEHVDVDVDTFQRALARLVGGAAPW